MALQEQAPLAVCSPPALPVGSDSLPYISSQFNGAYGCFVVILTRPAENHHSLRGSSGCLLSLIWPISPPSLPLPINSVILLDCATLKECVCVGGGHSPVLWRPFSRFPIR